MRPLAIGMTLVAAALIGGGATGAQQSPAVIPLPIESVLNQPTFALYAPIALSPDGERVAYAVTIPPQRTHPPGDTAVLSDGTPIGVAGTTAWVTDLHSHESIALTQAPAVSWSPVWSPDGSRLAYYSNRDGAPRAWLWTRATATSRRLSPAIIHIQSTTQIPQWTPDGRHIIVPIEDSRLPESPDSSPANGGRSADSLVAVQSGVTVLHASPMRLYGGSDSPTTRNRKLFSSDAAADGQADLAVFDVESGRMSAVVHGYSPLAYRASANGAFVAFTSQDRFGPDRGNWPPMDIDVFPIGQDSAPAVRTLISRTLVSDFTGSLAWNPRHTELAYSVADTAGNFDDYVADPPTWEPRRVSHLAPGSPGQATVHQASSFSTLWWSPAGRLLYTLTRATITAVAVDGGHTRTIALPEGNRLLSLVGDHDRAVVVGSDPLAPLCLIANDSTLESGFARADLRTGRWSTLRTEARAYEQSVTSLTFLDAKPAVDRVVYIAEDAQHPPDIWQSSLALTNDSQVTHIAADFDARRYGMPRMIEWRTAAGALVRGAVLLPSDYVPGRRYPLILYPYPREMRSRYLNHFGLFGGHVENMQIFATRGYAVLVPDAPIDMHDQMRDLARVLLPGIDRAIALGIADSTRLGIIGQSWGGYAALALLVQTHRFRAAVVRGGYADMVGVLGRLSPTGDAGGVSIDEWIMGGLPWAIPDRYVENSPIYMLDRVTTPVLLIHGDDDNSVPIALANEIFAGLQRLGREVDFARYAGEEHYEEFWSYPDQLDYLRRELDWFDRHLGASPRGAVSATRQPASPASQ